MKTLEENRYKRLVNADARRVAWFVRNQMSEDYETMPKSFRKRWEHAKYGKERYLANKFLESRNVKESQIERKLRQIIKEEIRRLYATKTKRTQDKRVVR